MMAELSPPGFDNMVRIADTFTDALTNRGGNAVL